MPVSMQCARGHGKRAEEWQGACFWAWGNPGGSQGHFLSSLTRITGTSQLKTHEVTEFQVVNVEFCCCVFHHEGSRGLRTLGYSGTGRFFFFNRGPFSTQAIFLFSETALRRTSRQIWYHWAGIIQPQRHLLAQRSDPGGQLCSTLAQCGGGKSAVWEMTLVHINALSWGGGGRSSWTR